VAKKVTSSEEHYLAEVERLAALYCSSSNLSDDSGRESAAYSLARLEVRAQAMTEKDAAGDLCSDEARSIPSVAREIRAVRAELGITAHVNEDDDDL